MPKDCRSSSCYQNHNVPPIFGRFSAGGERYHSQPLERLQLEIKTGRASPAQPVVHSLSFRLFVKRI